MLTKKRFLYIQNTVVSIKVESHDLSVKHLLLHECSFGIETFFFQAGKWTLLMLNYELLFENIVLLFI